jgi:hypothetical protein
LGRFPHRAQLTRCIRPGQFLAQVVSRKNRAGSQPLSRSLRHGGDSRGPKTFIIIPPSSNVLLREPTLDPLMHGPRCGVQRKCCIF